MRLQATLGSPELARLREALRRRLARGDRCLAGSLSLANVGPEERAAIDALLGRRPSRGEPVVIRLDQLDAIIRRGEMAPSLADAMDMLLGPIADLAAAARQRASAWDALFEEAESRVENRPDLLEWLASLRRSGSLKRVVRGEAASASTLMEALTALALRLPHRGTTLAALAAELSGDAHALDRGTRLSGACLGLLQRLTGMEDLAKASQLRRAWERVGVACDELSSSVLILNLRTSIDDAMSRGTGGGTGLAANACADSGEPCRLTLRQVLRSPPQWMVDARRPVVHVCENPSVLAAAADALGARALPLVCVEGQPSTAARLLLTQLVEAGATLRYHGDFDWAGVAIANGLVRQAGAQPWRMSTGAYRAACAEAPALASLSLKGRPVDAAWDSELRAEMERTGRAIHEEQVMNELVQDLADDAGR